jgi:MYXO-CTERM domain-containing protein
VQAADIKVIGCGCGSGDAAANTSSTIVSLLLLVLLRLVQHLVACGLVLVSVCSSSNC